MRTGLYYPSNFAHPWYPDLWNSQRFIVLQIAAKYILRLTCVIITFAVWQFMSVVWNHEFWIIKNLLRACWTTSDSFGTALKGVNFGHVHNVAQCTVFYCSRLWAWISLVDNSRVHSAFDPIQLCLRTNSRDPALYSVLDCHILCV